ncbi:hypothetical protein NFI96_008379 [Prochilodus magdalenae]|nr:hypothetical protein NFI96_008379 [Prochilodus magdalenae]
MFREASNNNIDEYTDSVTGFIRKCIEDVVPTKPVRVYPNQKPWLNCEALNARTAAFKSGHLLTTCHPGPTAVRLPTEQIH